ncbi:MAG: DUF2088 domain-containing protein [Lachnospiraceae bacterium]|nr:DUF2088 domain-containing protein [Lachnospiraceae bacterium]
MAAGVREWLRQYEYPANLPEKTAAGESANLPEKAAVDEPAGPAIKKVLILPPDLTRCYSFAGEITKVLWKELVPKGVHVDIMPALGTHMELTAEEKLAFFGDEIPEEAFLVHHWATDTVKLGAVPAEVCKEASGGLFDEEIEVEVNHRLFDGGYDLILSVGQVVPHEAVGMSNYSKNIFIGVGGRAMINKIHMMTSICGVENTMGIRDTSGRKVYDYAQEHFLDGKCPIAYMMTVVVQNEIELENGQKELDLSLRGLFMGTSRKPFEEACALSQKCNITHVERRANKVVTYLDPNELKTTWVGNKGIYRTRMMIADGGELLILAPGVAGFGENEEMEQFLRKYGYRTTEEILKLYRQGEFDSNILGASHIIISSPDGRFSITYATRPELLSKEDIESVHLRWADYEETAARYDPDRLEEGWNIMPDGEEIYFVHTPALGLWKADD